MTTRNYGFEFVKQLGEELSSGDFDLPPFPDTAFRIQKAINDPDASIDTLTDLVLSEPALAARLLRLANSALMRGAMEITEVREAITRTGLDMVQNVAVSFAAREAFKAPDGSTLQERLDATRRHSVSVAVLAYLLARKVEFTGKADEAMLAGLLHAVGKFYILTRIDQFPELFSDEQAIDELLGQWHAGVGRAIVESWGFPETIAHAVDEHEVTERDHELTADLTDLVLVASILVQNEGGDLADAIEGLPSLERMGIEVQELLDYLAESDEQARTMISAMSG